MPLKLLSTHRILGAFLLFLTFSFSAKLAAQDINSAPDWHFEFGGKVTEFNDKKQKDQALEGAVVTLLKGPTQVQSVVTNNSGRFKFVLDPNNDYTVTVTKPGYITKRFSISTYNVPVERGEGSFAPYDIEVGLFKIFPGLDYSCLDKPIAKIAYSPAKDVEDFDWDKVYTQSIQACIDELKRLEAEARAKQKLYDAAIEKADKAFAASNWQGAKDAYNEALTYLPNEKYPKDQIIKCDEKLGASAKTEADYKAAIAEGDRLFGTSDWAGAKAQYQKASGIKTTEQYPKDQILKCDNNIASAGKKAEYDAAIKDADAKFAAGDFAGAKAKYQQASNLMTLEQYPKDQIVKCDAEIAKAANKAKYDAAIADADAKFKASDWANAKTKYQEASALIATEQYPKDQIGKCDAEIARQGVQQKYDAAIKDADTKFAANDFTGAKTKYQEASALKTAEQYPKDQIVKCDAGMAGAELQKKYDAAIKDADAKFAASDFAGAKVKYQEASALKSAEQYPKDQIAKCDAEIAKKGLQEQYDAAIKAADAKFGTSDWAGAKTKYQEASNLKAAEQYPKDQIAKCDAEIAKKGAQDKYDAAIKDADAKFAAADFAGAKGKYQEASGLKSAEQYPKDQIAKCDAEIAKMGLQQKYDAAIKDADAKFKANDFAGAKTKYQEASDLKSTEQYPKDQIAKCDAEIAKKGVQDQYNAAIKDADAKFKASDWTAAKAKYMEASGIKTEEQYPKDQIVKCDAEIAKKGVQEQYNALIADADAKFKAADFTGAKSVYQQALDLKSAEAYPKAQIAKCDAEMAKKGVQEQYDAIIKDADAKFGTSDWSGAKSKYQEASGLKSAEAYPKTQIAKCDANMATALKDAKYTSLIASADSSFKLSDWSGAKSLYQQASVVKAAEAYPKDQIAKCDAEIAKSGKDKQYNELIAKADVKFAASDWAGAKVIYLQATAVKAEEQYPKDQVAKCDANVTASKDAAYNKIIASADSLFKLPDFTSAKAKYKEANTSRPNEAYPKDQMAKCDAEIAKMGKDKQYSDLIAKADVKFGATDWAGAKALYVQASGVKAEEQYPKDQIAKCDANVLAAKDAAYNRIIASADSLFKLPDFTSAKAKYKEANTSRPNEAYPKDQMAKCDAEIAKMGKDKQYSDLIAKADVKFGASDWAGAKTLYTQASGVKAEEQYPKDQIAKCDANALAAKDAAYNKMIATADSLFKLPDYLSAKNKYKDASASRPTEAYPKDQMAKCDIEIAKMGKDKQYTDLIAKADVKFGASDWAGAKLLYQQASAVKTEEQYPKDQIAKCDGNIANAGTQTKYDAAIKAADAKFKLSDWTGAKAKYQEALGIKAGEEYPTSQIAVCDNNLAAAAAKKYTDAIAAADAKYNAGDWTAAKAKYQEASAMKTAEQYPKDRIALCDQNISRDGVEKTYLAAIAAADAKFKASDWNGAKAKYNEALGLKSAEQYPKDQIKLCDDNLASAAGLDANYARKIAVADSAFKTEDYETAKSNYEGALTLKPGQAYPTAQLAEINKRLAAIDALNAKDAKYRATIAKADSLFTAKDFKAAKVQYQSASTQRPAEQYPKDRMALCDTELSNAVFEAAKQKKYDDLIKKADIKFKAGAWQDARNLYSDALKEKPIELYPKTQIAECDKKLHPVAVKDTARTPEQIKEDYRNDIAKNYPQGLTQIEEKDGGNTTIKRIVVIGDKGYIYTKKVYSWGVFYFKDGVQISEGTFNYETSPGYISQQQAAGSK
jgi:hypothetical protein